LAMGTSQYTTATLGSGPANKISNAHGVDPKKFNPNETKSYTREDLGLSNDSLVFCVAARLYESDEKGQLLVTQSLARLNDLGEKIDLLLFGDPTTESLADNIRTTAENCEHLSVHLLGSVGDLERYFDVIDISVNARKSAEPFGLSVLESMMMSTPVIAHALGGPAELIIDGESGWHVKQANVTEFAAAFNRAISQKQHWKKMGENARQRANSVYSLESEAKRWITHAEEHAIYVERSKQP